MSGDNALAYRTLLDALAHIAPGRHVHADMLREAFDAANLTSAEKSGALKAACTAGYLHAVTILLDDGMTIATVQVRSSHAARKSGWSMLYRRTDKPVEVAA